MGISHFDSAGRQDGDQGTRPCRPWASLAAFMKPSQAIGDVAIVIIVSSCCSKCSKPSHEIGDDPVCSRHVQVTLSAIHIIYVYIQKVNIMIIKSPGQLVPQYWAHLTVWYWLILYLETPKPSTFKRQSQDVVSTVLPSSKFPSSFQTEHGNHQCH